MIFDRVKRWVGKTCVFALVYKFILDCLLEICNCVVNRLGRLC